MDGTNSGLCTTVNFDISGEKTALRERSGI